MSQRTVFMITALWPPVNSLSTRRPVKLAQRLAQLGWTPIVLTPDPPGAYALHPPGRDLTFVGADVEVHRVPAPFRAVRFRRTLSRVLIDRLRLEKVGNLALAATDRMLVPDHLTSWRAAAVRAARRIVRRQKVDAVWVTAPPFGALVVGAAVASAIGRPLVLDYRDPWTQGPRHRPPPAGFHLPPETLEALEGEILQQAAGVGYVYEQNRVWNEARFGRPLNADWRLIPNGFDASDLPGDEITAFRRPTMLYAGSCYGGRTLRPVLAAMRAELGAGGEVPDLVVHGELDQPGLELLERGERLRGYVRVHPRRPIDEVAPKMRGADALILLTGPEQKHAVPQRICDYLLAERPVLALGVDGSDVAEVIATTGTGCFVPRERGEAALRAALRQIVQRRFPYAPNPQEVHEWSADRMAERTASLLNAAGEPCARRPRSGG